MEISVANVALLGWFPVSLLLFSALTPQRAIITGFIAGTLFLPVGDVVGIPFLAWNKLTIMPLGLFLGALFFAAEPLLTFRPRWFDLVIVLYCLWPFAQLTDGFSLHACCSTSLTDVLTFGLPYLLGRAYLCDLRSARRLAEGIFIGGLIYVPLCIIEMRLGPELHRLIYGRYAFPEYIQAVRFGGYRPVVFMDHGLMVGFFMAAATICGLAMCFGGEVPQTARVIPTWLATVILAMATVATRSANAVVLCLPGVLGLLFARFLRNVILLYLFATIPVLYFGLRIFGEWDGQALVADVNSTMGFDRARSVSYRLTSERRLLDKALQKPIAGWGPNGAGLIYRKNGKLDVNPDGFWIIILGKGGAVALSLIYLLFLLPMLILLRKIPRERLSDPAAMAPLALALLAELFAIDCLANAMINEIYIVGIGSVMGLIASDL